MSELTKKVQSCGIVFSVLIIYHFHVFSWAWFKIWRSKLSSSWFPMSYCVSFLGLCCLSLIKWETILHLIQSCLILYYFCKWVISSQGMFTSSFTFKQQQIYLVMNDSERDFLILYPHFFWFSDAFAYSSATDLISVSDIMLAKRSWLILPLIKSCP